ncbi:MAG TPA: ribosome biogenesis GTPase Der [Candidatus Tenderia electrophaga]|uniref:GTPase Der n=2 Tax=Candidatus Tenderia electrophaga TaxID=1748243 RepID=A0A832J348_9GAMM|nr:ribosome biogenesis GTPase Der [Candidatus Tenderia electrophaga]
MKPVIALVGRPNVGKSTLFNQLTKSRDALVADYPGLTRDRKYGTGRVGDKPYIVVDTGGLSGDAEGIEEQMVDQVHQAIGEANIVLFLVDARAGLMAGDEQIVQQLRRINKQIFVVVNKIDGTDETIGIIDFQGLGMGEPLAIAATHGRNVSRMMQTVLADLPDAEEEDEEDEDGSVKVAIIGRPNVGKSTLVNRIMGEERVVAFDMPGTTRDSIFIPFERDDKQYTLIDTAGVRRRGRVKETVEKFSVIKALQAIEEANVVILVLDAHDGISEQDATLAGFALDAGRAMVIAVNKWDGLEKHARERMKTELDRRLPFLDFAEMHFISALHGTGVGHLFESVDAAFAAAIKKLPTPDLTRILEDAVSQHQPPMVRGRRIKLRYAHQGGRNPPLIVVHGTQTGSLPGAYKRYLMNIFRKVFKLKGTPVRVEFKSGDNPYAEQRKKPVRRQLYKKPDSKHAHKPKQKGRK